MRRALSIGWNQKYAYEIPWALGCYQKYLNKTLDKWNNITNSFIEISLKGRKMENLFKRCIFLLILGGILLSILNFIPRAEAQGIQGTTTTMSSPEMLYHYYAMYGEAYMYSRWLGMDLMYCLEQAFNCSMVY